MLLFCSKLCNGSTFHSQENPIPYNELQGQIRSGPYHILEFISYCSFSLSLHSSHTDLLFFPSNTAGPPLPQGLCIGHSLCLKDSPLSVYLAYSLTPLLSYTFIYSTSIWRVLFTILNLIPFPSIPSLLLYSLFFSKAHITFDIIFLILSLALIYKLLISRSYYHLGSLFCQCLTIVGNQ